MGLRVTLWASIVGLAVVAFVVCGALIETSAALGATNAATTRGFVAAELAEDARVDLRDMTRWDAFGSAAAKADLRAKLRASRSYATTADDSRAVAAAEAGVEGMLDGTRAWRPIDAASADAALNSLVASHERQTRRAFERSRAWDERGCVFGALIAALIVVSIVWLLRWLQETAVQPMWSLRDAMCRFAKGDREARATPRGCAELREMALQFNAVAGAIATERAAEMTFLASVVHDLKNPLASLRLCVQNMNRGEIVEEVVSRANRQLARLDRMTGDLLDFSRIEAGRLEMKFTSVDVRGIVRRATDLFDGMSPPRVIEIAQPAEPVLVTCDALRIEQVVANLVSNALKYSPTDAPVAIAVERADGFAVVRVVDRGVGISAEDQKRLFAPFCRVGLSTESVPGVGLGLSVVRRIVAAHRGRIDLESEPGRGSVFTVLLPLA